MAAYLTKNFGSAGNRKTMTWSWWFKQSAIPTGGHNAMPVWGGQQTSYPTNGIRIENTGRLVVRSGVGAGHGDNIYVITTRKFLDTASWYHFVVIVDTTQATDTNRVKIYVNGVQETAFDTYTVPAQDTDTQFNKGDEDMHIGRFGAAATYDGLKTGCNGYFAHYHFVDGTAYTPATFGSTDSVSGEWKANLTPTVTYGTHGCFLKFENAGALGTDSSGNSKTWTVNGDCKQSISTPNNTFATWNCYHTHTADMEVSNGGLSLDYSDAAYSAKPVCATLAMNSGKWYWEVKNTATGGYLDVGFCRNGSVAATNGTRQNLQLGNATDANSWAFKTGNSSGYIVKSVRHNNADVIADMGITPAANDIIQVWLDLDNGKAWWGVNGTVLNGGSGTGVPNSGTYPHVTFTVGDEYYLPACSLYGFNGSPEAHANFGEGRFNNSAVASAVTDAAGLGAFEYDPLAGFYAVCTKNIKTYG
jgi:hypothetical protein